MSYYLEVKKDNEKWILWTRGTLEDVLSEFFYLQVDYNPTKLRIVWTKE